MRGPKPKITGCGSKLKRSERFECWNPSERNASDAEPDKKRKMLTEALRIVIKFIMKNHVYEFDNKIHKQSKGGAIGVELTGDLTKVFMVWWTKQFLSKMRERETALFLYKIYVDDINMLMHIPNDIDAKPLSPDEKEIESSKRVEEVGNSIHHSIIVKADCPARHPDKKLPILDLKSWLDEKDEKRIVLYEFYQKDVSSKATINARSTLPWKSKHTILVQQTLRILRNCSRNLQWDITASHLTKMSMRMQYSGFDKTFRYNVISTAIAAFSTILEKAKKEGVPVYRPKNWKWEERRELKESRKKNWYKKGGYRSVIFVPATEGSELTKRFREVVSASGMEIKIVEKSGKTLEEVLRTSDPRKERRCRRGDCPVCSTDGKGNCKALNINYQMTCECEEGQYTGTTTRGAYVRGKEHISKIEERNPKSDLWQHCVEKHNGVIKRFKMDVIESFKNDPLLRQVSEATRISRADKKTLINRKEEMSTSRTN